MKIAPYIVTDLQGNVLDYNDQFLTVIGIKNSKIPSNFNTLDLWVHQKERDKLIKRLQKNGYVKNFHAQAYDINKNIKDVYVNVILTRDDEGKLNRIETILFDNTFQKKYIDELMESKILLEGKVQRRTKALFDANNKLTEQNKKLKEAENSLHKKNSELENKNNALREIMGQLSIEKENMVVKVQSNIDNLILPLLDQLKTTSTHKRGTIIDNIELNLKNITDSFGQKVSTDLNILSPREIEICKHVKNGLSSKEISEIMTISEKTVVSHRNRIRRKLKINNTKTNLTTYLNSL